MLTNPESTELLRFARNYAYSRPDSMTPSADALAAYVQTLLAQARAEEREACAKVCDDAVCTYNSNEQDMLAKQLAFLIRARKDAPCPT